MRRAAALLVALAGCSAAARSGAQKAPPPAAPEKIDREAALDELEAKIRDGYRSLGQGYDNVYLETLAHDTRLVLIGIGGRDVIVGFDPRALDLLRLFHDDDYELISKDLAVHVAADGCCAWMEDDLAYRVPRGHRRAIVPLRSTAAFERREGRWVRVLDHLSYAGGEADEESAPFAASTPPGDLGAHVRDLLLARIADTAEARASVVLYDDVVVIGPNPGQELRGKAVGELESIRNLAGAETVEPVALRVELSTFGTVAWAAAVLKLGGAGGATTARATWVLEKRDPADFQVVQLHVSLPAARDALAREIFGEAPADAGAR
jgi:ketosteroid isomerase-like protein